MATTLDQKAETGSEKKGSSRTPRSRWTVGILAAVALAAVTVAAVAVFWPAPKVQAPERVSTSSPLYTPQEQTVMRLVAEGVLPQETLDGGIYLIKSLINQGLIPRETLEPYTPPIKPLYTEQEQTVMRLVAEGLLPQETLEGGAYLIKSLINQGLIPREAAYPADSGR
jgi:hypothetical protein